VELVNDLARGLGPRAPLRGFCDIIAIRRSECDDLTRVDFKATCLAKPRITSKRHWQYFWVTSHADQGSKASMGKVNSSWVVRVSQFVNDYLFCPGREFCDPLSLRTDQIPKPIQRKESKSLHNSVVGGICRDAIASQKNRWSCISAVLPSPTPPSPTGQNCMTSAWGSPQSIAGAQLRGDSVLRNPSGRVPIALPLANPPNISE